MPGLPPQVPCHAGLLQVRGTPPPAVTAVCDCGVGTGRLSGAHVCVVCLCGVPVCVHVCRYYTGECVAPVLTLFVGGNHEASNYLRELHYGGWVAPNIYYLGSSGVVWFGGLRIGGVSGIYKPYDYPKPYHERPPYDESALKSVFHVRGFDYYRLAGTTPSFDLFVSHDWPQGVAK